MHIAPHFRFTGLRAAWLAVAVAGTAMAGEPIRFSGRTGPAQPLDFDRREPFLPTEASTDRFGQRSGLPTDGFLYSTQPITPTTGLTRKQLEAQEQRRNWLMQSPETLLKQATERDGKFVDEANPEETRLKTPAERMKEERDGKNNAEDRYRNDPMHSQDRDRNRPRTSVNERRDANGNLIPGENKNGFETRNGDLVRTREDGGFFNSSEARGNSLSRTFTENKDRERQREREASLDAFKRTFSNPWSQTTAVGGMPTIGGSSGGGPLAGPGTGPGDMRRSTGIGGGFDTGSRGASSLGTGGSSFDPKNPLNYGTADTVFKQPATTTRSEAAPVILTIPKRKF
ncbi:MAG: hypothetical protein EBS05_21560 [Proteobacteria bacterium]|nr:hypothetical protein [Pseudomonadota bacterium]